MSKRRKRRRSESSNAAPDPGQVDRSTTKRGGRLRSSLGYLIGALLLAAGLWVGLSEWMRYSMVQDLPTLPDLTGLPSGTLEHLLQADAAARNDPGKIEIVGGLCRAYHADLFYDPALACYRLAREMDPENWRWPYLEALIHEELGDSKAASLALKRVVEVRPGSALAWYRLGRAALKLNQLDRAEQAFAKTLATSPKAGPAHRLGATPVAVYAGLGMARVRLKQGKVDEARQLLEAQLVAAPAFGPAHRLLGRVYKKIGRDQEAADRMASANLYPAYQPPADPEVAALARESFSSSFLLKQMKVAEQRADRKWSETLARRAVQVAPGDLDAAANLGLFLLESRRLEEALPTLTRYRNSAGADTQTLTKMAHGLASAGRADLAADYARRALKINPKAVDAHNRLAQALADLGKLDEAIDQVRRALEHKPDLVDSHNNLGVFLARKGEIAEAISHFEEAIRIRPDSAAAHSNLGMLLSRKGELKQARIHLERVVRIKPDDVKVLINLGTLAAREGDLDGALALYRRVLELAPDLTKAHLGMAVVLAEKRQWKQAVAHYQTALRKNPNLTEAVNRLAWILATCPEDEVRDGRLALKMARQVSQAAGDNNPRYLATLAAAHAETGDFQRAIEALQQAEALAKTKAQSEQRKRLQQTMAEYQAGRPTRQP